MIFSQANIVKLIWHQNPVSFTFQVKIA